MDTKTTEPPAGPTVYLPVAHIGGTANLTFDRRRATELRDDLTAWLDGPPTTPLKTRVRIRLLWWWHNLQRLWPRRCPHGGWVNQRSCCGGYCRRGWWRKGGA